MYDIYKPGQPINIAFTTNSYSHKYNHTGLRDRHTSFLYKVSVPNKVSTVLVE